MSFKDSLSSTCFILVVGLKDYLFFPITGFTFQSLVVKSGDTYLGKIIEYPTCCIKRLEIFNEVDDKICDITGPCILWTVGCNNMFQVLRHFHWQDSFTSPSQLKSSILIQNVVGDIRVVKTGKSKIPSLKVGVLLLPYLVLTLVRH